MRDRLIEFPIDDAILILKEEHKQRVDGYTTHLSYGGKGDPAEEAHLDALELAISALEQTKWISVKEQEQPTEYGTYLCHGYWLSSRRKKTETAEFFGEWNLANNFILTHWMPLPQPPKGE